MKRRGAQVVQVVELVESAFFDRKPEIDREKCVVKNVKILGPQSRNAPPHNNAYPETTRRNAINVLEGGRCFINHDDDSRKAGATRKYGDSFGVHSNIREGGDGLYSDFHYNPKHALAEQFLWDCEHAPQNVGFSIATNGRKRVSGGQSIVEEILFDRNQHSIDLVCKGATTNSISESERRMSTKNGTKTTTPRALLREVFKGNAPMIKIVEEELPAAEADASMPAPAEGETADPMDAGFAAMLKKLIDQYAAGDIDLQALIGKLKDIDKAWTKLSGEEPAAAPTEEKPTTEGQRTDNPTLGQLQEELRVLRHEQLAGKVCAAAGVVPSGLLTHALKTAKDEAEMKTLVEEFKTLQTAGASSGQQQGSGKARSAGTTQPAGGANSGNGKSGAGTGPISESLKPSTMSAADRIAFLRNGRLPAPAAAK
jgi:hypothetical protein